MESSLFSRPRATCFVLSFLACSFFGAWGSSALAQSEDSAPSPAPVVVPNAKAVKPAAPPSAIKAAAQGKAVPLSPEALPENDDGTVPGVYKDMVVVQRKAKVKAKSFLFSTFATIDFSDGPITNYALNTNIGYAFSDQFELYIDLVPAFVTIERPIVAKVRALTLANGAEASISYAKPKYQYGLEGLWLPAYGKESWGAHSIIRSDTFFKVSAGQTAFESGDSGLRFALTVGKTYFVRNAFNIRVDAGVSYAQTVVDQAKTGTWAPVLEAGLVWYF